MAKMIAFGDSFTWGSDMGDTMRDFEWWAKPKEWRNQKANMFDNLYSRRTWQAKLAKKLGLDYKCYAEQGCSNQSIVRQFFKYAPSFKEGDLISVNFTWRNRYDFFDTETDNWETVRPSGTEDSKYHEIYYKHIQSVKWDQIESLKAIILILGHLKYNNIDFIATCIDDEIFDDQLLTDPVIGSLTDVCKDDIRWFEDKGFHKWSIDNNYPISPMWHPLEEAHEAAFEYLSMNWIDINHRLYGTFHR